jgi:uncharacterized membrane protein YfcA
VLDEQLSSVFSFFVGCGSGIAVGIASGTAESFMIPFLTIVLTNSIYQAIGSSLFVDCMIGGMAGIIFLLKGNVNVKPVSMLAITGVMGAVIGSFFTAGTPESGLTLLIAIVLIVLGLTLIRGGVKKNVDYVNSKFSFTWFKNNKMLTFIIFGTIIGFSSGFIGMGSSGAMTFILVFIMGYDLHNAIGTSLLMMFFIAGSGAITHGLQGDFVYPVAVFAGIGACIGAATGSFAANKINEDRLGRLIGLVITIIGFIVLIELLFSSSF